MSDFEWSLRTVSLPLKHAFGISRKSMNTADNVFVRLQKGEYTGYGEAAPNTRYAESPDDVNDWLQRARSSVKQIPESLEAVDQMLDRVRPEVRSARAALEMALLDLWAKGQDQPLYRILEVPSNQSPATTMTIGLDEPAVIRQKVREAVDFSVLKVKLDGRRDEQVLEAIRAETDREIRVDVNEGWTHWEQAVEGLQLMKRYGVTLVEQPMPASELETMIKLRKATDLPFVADESLTLDEPMDRLAEAFDVVNIKLMKTGGILRSLRLVERARHHGLKVMVGCMVESSLADAASVLVSLWADYADLDGHLLLADDPFSGLHMHPDNRISLPDRPGLGIQIMKRKSDFFN